MERRALIYCRVSSKRQKKEGHGLESQEHRCRDYAARLGCKVEKVFSDDITGGGDYTKRPKMAEMLEHISKNGHKQYVVIFDDLKRLARDAISHWKLRDHLKSLGATVDSPNFDFSDDESTWLHEAISAVFNENERRTNRVQVIQKQKARLEKGYWTFNTTIPGYKRYGGKHDWILVRKEPEATVIKEALEGYATGRFLSKTEVRDFLRRCEFKNGKYIHLSFVDRLIERSPLYAGYIEYPKWEIERRLGHHERIISNEILEKIEAISAGKPVLQKRKSDNPDFPLRGFVCCEKCGSPMTASWSTGRKKKYPYYRGRNGKSCTECKRSFNGNEMEKEFQKLLKQIAPSSKSLQLVEAIFLEEWNTRVQLMEVKRKKMNKRIKELDDEESRAIRRVTSAKETLAKALEKHIGEIDQEREKLNIALSEMKVTEKDFGTALQEVFAILKNPYKYWKEGDFNDKRLVLKLAFAEPVTYSPENGFGTANLSMPVRIFEVKPSKGSQYVEMAGLNPRPRRWMKANLQSLGYLKNLNAKRIKQPKSFRTEFPAS